MDNNETEPRDVILPRWVALLILCGMLFGATVAGHNTRLYGMPWDHSPEPVGCLRPASDGPVTDPAIGRAWPEVCWQWTDAPAVNSGVAVSLWDGYCAGFEVRGDVGPFWHLPIIGGSADC